MIAVLNFERATAPLTREPELAPGLHRIDEILAVALARYEGLGEPSPELSNHRLAASGWTDHRELSPPARSKPLPR